MSEKPRDRTPARRRLTRVVMTLCAWLIAYLVVLALLTALGDELESLPLALRALVISGVLVTLMANLVMPVLNVATDRWLASARWGGSRASPEAASSSRERRVSAGAGRP